MRYFVYFCVFLCWYDNNLVLSIYYGQNHNYFVSVFSTVLFFIKYCWMNDLIHRILNKNNDNLSYYWFRLSTICLQSLTVFLESLSIFLLSFFVSLRIRLWLYVIRYIIRFWTVSFSIIYCWLKSFNIF